MRSTTNAEQEKEIKNKHIKCVLVSSELTINNNPILQGNLLDRYVGDADQDYTYEKTVFENTRITQHFRNNSYPIDLWTTDGLMLDRLRQLSYPQTDLFILMFSYDNAQSFKEIETKLHAELKRCVPQASIYLVGIHSAPEMEVVTLEEVTELAKKLNIPHVDCDSLQNEIIKNVFNTIFNDFLLKRFYPGKPNFYFSFFDRNFNSIKEGLQFAEQVTAITQGHTQRDNNLNKLPIELLFAILEETAIPLIKDLSNSHQIIDIHSLCSLVYNNANDRKAITRSPMLWNRTGYSENNDLVSIYPKLEEEDKQPKKKRCTIM